jgi:hypothetical protein
LGWDLQDLADYASKNLEAMNPPLFLRFLNLLMNDAIFLLDEAIQVKKGNIACVPIPFTVISMKKASDHQHWWQ